ncbi:MAG TPA: hypothetical protein VH988_25330 [Thermoanaerobaculia bacterium]|jgi:photosystem II stability/assembly factor-like uncharacterized protein|nr:hypothetical protein [Thermoanaerobaculia bacterium]
MQSPMRPSQVFAVLLLILLSIAAPASAAPHWVQATPFGGDLSALAQAPSSPQTLYAATVSGRLFRSLDGGATWGERQSGLPAAVIVDLSVDPQDPRTVFARTSSTGQEAVLRSRNGGLSWTPVGPGFGPTLSLALDDDAPGVLYAAAYGGLYRSADFGDTWAVSAFAGSVVYAVAIDPHDSNTFLAAVAGSSSSDPTAFWRSTDHGATWAAATVGETPPGLSPVVQRIVFDPARTGTAYAFLGPQIGELGTVFRTTDDGATWSFLASTPGLRDLAPSPDGTLFAAASYGVARSNDLGETWTPPLTVALRPANAPRDVLSRLLVTPSSPEILFAAGTEGIWKSTDGGGSWALSNQGIDTLTVISLAVAPTGPSNVVAVAGNDIFRSADHGVTWSRVHSILDGPQPDRIDAFDPRNAQTIYGVGFDGLADYLAKSTDGGSSWQRLSTGFSCGGDSICEVDIPTVALDPLTPDTVYAGIFTFFHFQGASDHLLRSPNGGATWKALTPLKGVQELAFGPRQDKALYGLTCKGVFKSAPTGASWHRVGSGLPAALCSNNTSPRWRLAIDPSAPQTLYVGTAAQGVFRSADGGATFHSFNRGLETADVTIVLVDPTNPAHLYAAVTGKGVWQWDVSLRRWTPLNTGLPVWDFDGVLALDPQHPSTLYAGTLTHGAFRLDP